MAGLTQLFTFLAILINITNINTTSAYTSKNISPFLISTNHVPKNSPMKLDMAPRYNTAQARWEAIDPEDGPEAGYGLLGSVIRAGPLPLLQRIFNADKYEQSVLKYMANEGVSRMEAQGNMDAYFENPNDWAFQKMSEKKGAPKRDYANVNTSPKQLILSGIWACIVFAFIADFYYEAVVLETWKDAPRLFVDN